MPTAPMRLVGPGGPTEYVEGLVDSGASITLASRSLITHLGISLDGCKSGPVSGLGVVTGYESPVLLDLEVGEKDPVQVAGVQIVFVDKLPFDVVLGHRNVFQQANFVQIYAAAKPTFELIPFKPAAPPASKT